MNTKYKSIEFKTNLLEMYYNDITSKYTLHLNEEILMTSFYPNHIMNEFNFWQEKILESEH